MALVIISSILLLIGIAGFFYLSHLMWRGPYKVVATMVLESEHISIICGGQTWTETHTIFLLETRRGHRKFKADVDAKRVASVAHWLAGGELPRGARRI